MPYRPFSPASVDRSYAYKYEWFSAVCSVACLLIYLRVADTPLIGLLFGGAVGGLLASSLAGRADTYFQSLCAVGHRWMVFALSLYLLAGWVIWWKEFAIPAARAGSQSAANNPAGALFFDGYLVAICLAMTFHAGYLFQWARDYLGASEEA